MWAAAIGPPPDDTKTYSLFYAFLLSVCCRYTAAFCFCASSNSRFNSLTIAISLAGSVSATASRQRSRQSLRASWVIDASQKRKNYSNVIAEMLSRPTCAKLVLLCKFACKSAADNLHSKTKAEPLAEFSASVVMRLFKEQVEFFRKWRRCPEGDGV